ncbi:MAG: TIGR04283 family arsenosugar biosynthesis glycosyltransferase [Thermodesulfobacteriota bacterium]
MSTAPKTSPISVIIPARNEAAVLPALLAALAREKVREIIVADGGSSDGTAETACRLGARVASSPPGRGRQMNAGAALAGGEMLLFLHADTLPPSGFSTEIQRLLADPAVILGAFRLGIAGQGAALRVIEVFANLRARLGLPYGDQGLFLRAADFRALGGFAPLPLLEDVELVKRLRRRGKIRLAGTAVRTSARRWQRLGVLRTTLRNALVLLGFGLGIDPERLARFYRR